MAEIPKTIHGPLLIEFSSPRKEAITLALKSILTCPRTAWYIASSRMSCKTSRSPRRKSVVVAGLPCLGLLPLCYLYHRRRAQPALLRSRGDRTRGNRRALRTILDGTVSSSLPLALLCAQPALHQTH